MSSSDRFGFEWHTYSQIEPYQEQYKNQFLNWIWPLQPEFFKDKAILDAGCGMGRNSFWCLEWGVKRLVAFDKDERSVKAAKENLKKFPQAEIVKADIYNLPWQNQFDFIFAIGVIHHLKKPHLALAQLKKALKPGGEILLWVYGRLGFENYVRFLNPIRKNITSKMSPALLHFLVYFISLPFYLYLKIFNPAKPYFQQLRHFAFSHVHSIIFDQLLPEIANYYTKEEAAALLSEFNEVSVAMPPNQSGWVVRGKNILC